MYQKVRLRLTGLFILVTSILLTGLLLVSFFFSARQQLALQLSSFTSQSHTVIESLSDQTILTSYWLSSREDTVGFRVYLWDNGVELFHNKDHANRLLPVYSLYLPTPAKGRTLRQAAGTSDIYIGQKGIFPEVLYYHKQLVKNDSVLQVYFLQSLSPLYEHIRGSLLVCLLLLIGAECLLALFCWHFTGRLLKPLSDSLTSQNRFISGVSHELRTPLAVILANASACEKAPPAEQKSFFQVIAREGAQMSDMLEQLLTLSRADSHGLPLQIEETDLQTLLLETYENFLPLASASGHLLSVRLPEDDIPLCSCDSSRIRQVCHILLHNALSHTHEGSAILLFIGEGPYEKGISIGVQDNGGGIPKAERAKIFERFYQGQIRQEVSGNERCSESTTAHRQWPPRHETNIQPSAPHKQKGHHGLGLAVAKEIAAAHKGSLTVSDAPGGGALFTLTLPVNNSL